MTREAWALGMGRLALAFPRRPSEDDAARAGIYREFLDEFEDEAWFFAVGAAIRNSRFFPSVAELRSWALEWRPPPIALLSDPEDDRSLEDRRADIRKGLQLIRDTVAQVERSLGSLEIIREMPKATPFEVEATNERLEALREQLSKIQ